MLKRNKKVIGIIVIGILLIILPIAVFLVNQRQDTRTGAAVDGGVDFNPLQDEKNVGEEFDVAVIVDGGTSNVSYVKMNLNFDENILEAISFTPSGNYTNLTDPVISQTGTISFEVVDASTQAPTGQVEVGNIKFKGKTAGTGGLAVTGTVMYATGEIGTVNVTTLSTGSYTITDQTGTQDDPSPTEDVCAAPTGLWPNGCACTSDHQCLEGLCAPNGTCTTAISLTPFPTTTLAPGETGISLSLKLPGIGIEDGENPSPERQQRNVWVTIIDASNNPVISDRIGTVTYNSSSGRYEGVVGLGQFGPTPTPTPALNDSYIVKAKVDNSLYKRVPGIVTIHYGNQNNTITPITLVTGDMNSDNTMSLEDYNSMVACYQRTSGCTTEIEILTDLNDNGTSEGDNDDFNIMQRAFAIREGD